VSQVPNKFLADHSIPLIKLSQSSAAAGQVPVWAGSDWVPAFPKVSTLVAANALVGSGTVSATTELQEVLNRLAWPTVSQASVFAGDGTLTSVTYYQNSSQITANRMAVISMTYDANLNPATETLTFYNLSDGTTVIKTVTKTYTFTNMILTNITQVTA